MLNIRVYDEKPPHIVCVVRVCVYVCACGHVFNHRAHNKIHTIHLGRCVIYVCAILYALHLHDTRITSPNRFVRGALSIRRVEFFACSRVCCWSIWENDARDKDPATFSRYTHIRSHTHVKPVVFNAKQHRSTPKTRHIFSVCQWCVRPKVTYYTCRKIRIASGSCWCASVEVCVCDVDVL